MHVREKCILAPTGKETSMQQNQKRNCKSYGSGSNQSTISTLVDNNERQCTVPPNNMLFMEIVQANSLRATQMLLACMYVCMICHIKYVCKLL